MSLPICDNCGYTIPHDLRHQPDPYEKGVCQTFDVDIGIARGWTRKRENVNFERKEKPDERASATR